MRGLPAAWPVDLSGRTRAASWSISPTRRTAGARERTATGARPGRGSAQHPPFIDRFIDLCVPCRSGNRGRASISGADRDSCAGSRPMPLPIYISRARQAFEFRLYWAFQNGAYTSFDRKPGGGKTTISRCASSRPSWTRRKNSFARLQARRPTIDDKRASDGYSAAASKMPGSCEAATGCPSRRHQSIPPSSSLARNPSRASLYAPLVDALQPIPSQ